MTITQTQGPGGLQRLWEGALLASLAHAVGVARYPELANLSSWSSGTYSVQDNMGSRGTIVFEFDDHLLPVRCAGGLFTWKSSTVTSESHPPLDAHQLLAEMPNQVRTLAAEAFQYLLYDPGNGESPWVSTTIWANGDKLESRDDWDRFRANGGHLLEQQVRAIDSALPYWINYYSLSEDEAKLVREVFGRRVAAPARVVRLTTEEVELIRRRSEDGVFESEQSFSELHIYFPTD